MCGFCIVFFLCVSGLCDLWVCVCEFLYCVCFWFLFLNCCCAHVCVSYFVFVCLDFCL